MGIASLVLGIISIVIGVFSAGSLGWIGAIIGIIGIVIGVRIYLFDRRNSPLSSLLHCMYRVYRLPCGVSVN